jgi:ribosomal protein S18 acetylase RimI-like enzyme
MVHADLANPVWHSLLGAQRHFALHAGELRWYPPAIAPFIAVPHAHVVPDLDAAARVQFECPAYFAGVLPTALPGGWVFSSRSEVLQMIPVKVQELSADEEDIRLLQAADRPRMVELAQMAFPDFFRERTAELGIYLGIFRDSALVAMAGERMALGGFREISGVCTHPGYTGRGFARRLTRALLYRHRQRGLESFLHVSENNAGARRLYESMGFVVSGSIEMGKVERSQHAS